jgi:hypothetical protein
MLKSSALFEIGQSKKKKRLKDRETSNRFSSPKQTRQYQ